MRTRRNPLWAGMVCLLGGAMYALLYALGSAMERQGTCAMPQTLLRAAGLTPVFALVLTGLLSLCEGRRTSARPSGKQRPFHTLGAFAVILSCYLPMFVIMYPGMIGYDAGPQIIQVMSGRYSAHHPLLHTLMLGAFVSLRSIVGSVNRCFALYTITQMTLLAFCFAQTCASIARTSGLRKAYLAMLCFALHPMHAFFSTAATKDVLFSGALTLMLALAIEMEHKGGAQHRGLSAAFVISGVFACLLRNNMMYAAVVWMAVLLMGGRTLRRTALCVLMTVILAAGIDAGLRSLTHAEKVNSREMLSMPLQQIIRVCRDQPEQVEPEELALLNEAIDVERAVLAYDPMISDPVKNELNVQVVKRHAGEYLRLYAAIGSRCPGVYLDAAIELTYPFLYPYSAYRRSRPFISSGTDYRLVQAALWEGCLQENERFAPVRRWLADHFWKNGASDIPGVRWVFNMGLMVWLMLFFALREAYAGRSARLAVDILPVLLWGTYLLGPVMNGRYAYPFLCVLPVLAFRPRPDCAHTAIEGD